MGKVIEWFGSNAILFAPGGTIYKADGVTPIGGGGNAFGVVQPPMGTSPTASTTADTLILASGTTALSITGNSGTKTITFAIANLVNADISSSAAIALSKLATSGDFSTSGNITAGSATAGTGVLNVVTGTAAADYFRIWSNDGTFAGTASGSRGFMPYNAAGYTEENFYSNTGHRWNFYQKNGSAQRARWFVDQTTGFYITTYNANQIGLRIVQGLAATSNAEFVRYDDLNGLAVSGVDKFGKSYFTLGTAALPSIYPTSDSNTGIWSSGADTLDFSTNGVNKLQLTSGGELAIQTVGKGLSVKEGSNARMGTATLVGGTVTVSNTAVTASSRILVCTNADGGTPGAVRVSAKTAATSFVITSSSGTDTSAVVWIIFEPS